MNFSKHAFLDSLKILIFTFQNFCIEFILMNILILAYTFQLKNMNQEILRIEP